MLRFCAMPCEADAPCFGLFHYLIALKASRKFVKAWPYFAFAFEVCLPFESWRIWPLSSEEAHDYKADQEDTARLFNADIFSVQTGDQALMDCLKASKMFQATARMLVWANRFWFRMEREITSVEKITLHQLLRALRMQRDYFISIARADSAWRNALDTAYIRWSVDKPGSSLGAILHAMPYGNQIAAMQAAMEDSSDDEFTSSSSESSVSGKDEESDSSTSSNGDMFDENGQLKLKKAPKKDKKNTMPKTLSSLLEKLTAELTFTSLGPQHAGDPSGSTPESMYISVAEKERLQQYMKLISRYALTSAGQPAPPRAGPSRVVHEMDVDDSYGLSFAEDDDDDDADDEHAEDEAKESKHFVSLENPRAKSSSSPAPSAPTSGSPASPIVIHPSARMVSPLRTTGASPRQTNTTKSSSPAQAPAGTTWVPPPRLGSQPKRQSSPFK